MRTYIHYHEGTNTLLALLLVLLMVVTAFGVMASVGTHVDEMQAEGEPSTPEPAPGQLVLPSDLEPMPLNEPITLSDEAIAKMKAMSCPGVREVPEDAAPSEVRRFFGTRGGMSHHEPDHEGQYYNNNVTCAEPIDISSGFVEFNASGTTGDQPRLWINWSQDNKNPSNSYYYADYDIYYIDLAETSSSIDFVNITLTVDYGTTHGAGNERSNKDFGAQMTLFTGSEYNNDVNRNQIKVRPVWYPGTQAIGNYNDFLDSWIGATGAMYNSMHFQPAYTGKYYILVEPLNVSQSPNTSVEEVWYNLSITYTSKGTSGAFTHGKSATSDIKDSPGVMSLAADGCSGKGYQDILGNTPIKDPNSHRVDASAWPSTLPSNNQFVNEMLDYNDWYNASGKLLGDPANKEDINVSIDVYDSFVITFNGGPSLGTTLIFSLVFLEVWQHDPATNKFWYNQDFGGGYILFNDQSGNPWDWTHPFVHIVTNDTTDLLYVRTWTDTIFWCEYGSQMYWGDMYMDVYDSWGYYNLTKCNVTKYIPPTAPSLAGGAVSPSEGPNSMAYCYNVTYYDANNDPPAAIYVNINSVLHSMVKNLTNANILLRDGDYRNGEAYIYQHPPDSFPDEDKVHSFIFYAKDPGNRVATGDISTHAGPHINPLGWGCLQAEVNYADPIIVNEDDYNAGVRTCYYNMSAKFWDSNPAHDYHLTFKVRGSTDGPWSTSFDCSVFTLTVNSNNTLSINTMPDINTKGISGIPLYFNATDPAGNSLCPSTPVYLIVRPVNDPPRFEYLYQEGFIDPMEILDYEEVYLWAAEDHILNIRLMAKDIDGTDTLDFAMESAGSYLSSTSIEASSDDIGSGYWRGNFSLLPPKDYVGVLLANISANDGNAKDWVVLYINVTNMNDPPVLTQLRPGSVDQYAFLNMTISASDIDFFAPNPDEELTFTCNISDSIPGLIKGVDWDLYKTSATTAGLWFHPVSQDIIGLNTDKKTYNVQFRVTDRDGAFTYQDTIITIRNVNDLPEQISDFTITIVDGYPQTPEIIENRTIMVMAPEIEDIDGDAIIYEWDFGDFRARVNGKEMNYTYYTVGNYTITLRYSDGSAETRQVSKNISVVDWYYWPDDDDYDDDYNDDYDDDDYDDDDDIVEEDTDNDKLPDSWEMKYFGNLRQRDTDDYDNDGFNNYKEYKAGTDPADKNDHPNGVGIIDTGINAWIWFLIFGVIIVVLLILVIGGTIYRNKQGRRAKSNPIKERIKKIEQKVWGKDIAQPGSASPPMTAKAPPTPAMYQNRQPEYITWHEYPEDLPPPPPWYDPKKTLAETADEVGEFSAPALDMDVLDSRVEYSSTPVYEGGQDIAMGPPVDMKKPNEEFLK